MSGYELQKYQVKYYHFIQFAGQKIHSFIW